MMKRTILRLAIPALLVASLAGCNRAASAPHSSPVAAPPLAVSRPQPDQAHVCEVSNWQGNVSAAVCKAGQKVAFIPANWGNEQTPILFAAVNCDLRYSVALTSGGVTCIYAGPMAAKAKAQDGGPKSQPPARG